MKNLKEFEEKLVKIGFLEHCNTYGFYPFQMYVEHQNEKATVCALDLGEDVRAVYKAFADFYKEPAKRIYLAVDFPAAMDLKNDFVCIIGYENNDFTIYAIPYNVENGEQYAVIKHAEILTKILDDLGLFVGFVTQ